MRNPSMRRAVRVALTVITTAFLFFVAAIPAWAMTVTFVRHAESQANADGVIDTSVPGPGLSTLGQQQAIEVADELAGNGYDGIYVSSMLRTQQTAQPLADALGLPTTILPGLREIPAGIFEGSSEDEGLGRLGYALTPVAWTLGARFLPVLGGEDGNAFDARVDDELQQIYDSGDQNAVAFSHGATIMFWVMMNVENPDLGLLLSHQLDNAEAVVIEGSPEEGWTLVSWAGMPVAAQPSLPIKLFVNVRNLVVAPQTALYDVGQALATGDIAALANAVRDGIVNVTKAVVGFVPEMVRDIVESVPSSASVETSDQSATARSLTADIATQPSDDTQDSKPENASATVAEVKSKSPTTISADKGSNGATDLTDGNKAEPGKIAADAQDQPEGDAIEEEVTEPAEAPEVDSDDATDGTGSETDSAGSQQNAA